MEQLSFVVLQLLNGLSFSLLLFLAAAGLSITFGLMNLANLAHGAFYMFGGYLALGVVGAAGSFWLALGAVPLAIGALGALLEVGFLKPVYRRDHLDQVLLTFGFAYVFWDLANWIWGVDIYFLDVPSALAGSVSVLGRPYPLYRVVILAGGLVLAAALLVLEKRTRVGAILRAGVTDPEMLAAMGINVPVVFTVVFAFGAALAGLSGVVAGPIIGLYRGVDFEILLLAVTVVIVGGLGSLGGTFLSSLLIGMLDSLGRVYFPEFALASIFIIMAAVLLIRPSGLSGLERAVGGGGA